MKRILVLEDEYMLYKMLAMFLNGLKLPLEIVRAENGKEGLEIFYQNEFDLIIADFNMPIMNGVEFVLKLREEGHKLPIIMFSGSFEVERTAMEVGVTKFVAKPDFELLEEVLRQHF